MSEETLIAEDQSHYEVSLTAGQAFLAFVLLLLSLAASFAFGLMIGRGQADERLVVRKEPAVINEATMTPKKSTGRIVELGVADDDFKAPAEKTPATTDSVATVSAPAIVEEAPAPQPAIVEPAAAAPAPAVAHIAQLFSSADQKAAESLAARLIDAGFTNAYVERGTNDKGNVFRVRVKFASEAQAKAAEPKLHEFSKEVWITKQ